MAEYFVARDDIQKLAWELIGRNHPDLAGSLDKGELIVVFREKGQQSGGRVLLGSAKKATPMINALAGENYKFIIELPQDAWENLDAKQREACLDHHLCSCRADEPKGDGDTKFSIVKPDYSIYRDNVERYGMWFPKDEDGGTESDDDGTDPVADLFTGNTGPE